MNLAETLEAILALPFHTKWTIVIGAYNRKVARARLIEMIEGGIRNGSLQTMTIVVEDGQATIS
jgi:hypothetical protein